MQDQFNAFLDILNENGYEKIVSSSKLGYERESLRILNSKIASSPHPKSLGSSNCNRYITIDFSESQLELITPPIKGNIISLQALDNIYHFVVNNIGDEILWPLSMPPSFDSEDQIPVGNFGSSNEGKFKHVYRLGLANRYGKSMQTISGFHFNFSLPDEIWDQLNFQDHEKLKKYKSLIYFNILRNIFQKNWLLIYLFGASPVIDKKLVKQKNDDFIELGDNSLLLPYSTSLRMSEYGYSNSDRKSISVSINSLEEYVSDLRLATESLEPRYRKFENQSDSQLNPNILQIEAEYYATARAKSNTNNFGRPSTALINEGVSFIELRSIDISPFDRTGINLDSVLFLEMFMIFSTIEWCEMFNKEIMSNISLNDGIVAKYGRKPKLCLIRNNKKVLMSDWANEILDKMTPIAEQLDNDKFQYKRVIDSMRSLINGTSITVSEKLIEEINKNNKSQDELGNILGHKYKEELLRLDINQNPFWDLLKRESELSLNKQRELEKKTRDSKISFDSFKKKYYRS